MFPITLQLSGRRVVVVGGGSVGQRKAQLARDAGALVLLIDPAAPALPDDDGFRWIREPYTPEHLAGAVLVFACATPAVNAQVVCDANARGVWVNAASDPDAGSFHVPATLRIGDLAIAVSTGGAAPALARRIRDRLASEFDHRFADWVCLLNEMRMVVLATIPNETQRRVLLSALADWPWLERLRTEHIDAVRAAMLHSIIEAAGHEPRA